MEQEPGGRIGAESFDDFLASQGMLAEAEDVALERVLGWQIAEAKKAQGLAKTAMAARMNSDRRQLDRLRNPDTPSVTLSTLRRAAGAVGRDLRIELA